MTDREREDLPDAVLEGAEFVLERGEGQAVLHVAGEIDMVTSPELREHLAELAQEEVAVVVLDLSDVRFFDSSGLNAVVGGHRLIRHHGGEVRIVCTERRVLKVFDIAGLTRVFTIYPTVEAARSGPASE